MIPFKAVPVQYDLITLAGGLDLVTPTLSLPPGVARDAVNFEVSVLGGYTRIAGYERYDGQPNPSDALYNLITVDDVSSISVGDTIENLLSTASGFVIAINADTVVYTKASGSFIAGEDLYVSGSPVAEVTAIGGSVAVDPATAAQYTNLAADAYRVDIDPVPGSGPVRGVAYFGGDVYAWRDNVGATQTNVYKSSSSGWTQLDLGYSLLYTSGNRPTVPSVGTTITGATSGASAVITHRSTRVGDWSAGTAQGDFTFATITGGPFQNGENLQISGVTIAVASGASFANVFQPGGRVETTTSSFGGYSDVPSMFGADGINRAFELYEDGVFAWIYTGSTPDTPKHVAVHKNHLFLTIDSSLLSSAIGQPHNWDTANGASEIALNNPITQLLIQPGDQSTGAMAVYTRNDTFVLYGTSAADWSLVPYNVGTGAFDYTGQNLNQSFVLDDRGVINLATSLNYGNFDSAALTLNIRPFIQQRRNLATASCVNREKAQYRVFFSDGYGLYMTMSNGKLLGSMPIQFPNAVTCMVEGEKPDGTETSFFGSTNGYVYRLDAGTSFDGQEIAASVLLTYNHTGSPRVLKRYRKGSLEIGGTGYAEFTFAYELGYSTPLISQPIGSVYESALVASYWDSVNWDNFVWDGRTLAPSEVEVNGTAENIAVRISSISDIYPSFTVNSVILHYSLRRGLR
jgi:hypothetical protein